MAPLYEPETCPSTHREEELAGADRFNGLPAELRTKILRLVLLMPGKVRVSVSKRYGRCPDNSRADMYAEKPRNWVFNFKTTIHV